MEENLKEVFYSAVRDTVKNVQQDRDNAQSLLNNITSLLTGKIDEYHAVGTVANKYVESMQRSNDQLIKIATLLEKAQHRMSEKEPDFDFNSLANAVKNARDDQ